MAHRSVFLCHSLQICPIMRFRCSKIDIFYYPSEFLTFGAVWHHLTSNDICSMSAMFIFLVWGRICNNAFAEKNFTPRRQMCQIWHIAMHSCAIYGTRVAKLNSPFWRIYSEAYPTKGLPRESLAKSRGITRGRRNSYSKLKISYGPWKVDVPYMAHLSS